MEINCLTVDIRLGLFATASSGAIFTWDYESFKLLGAASNRFKEIEALEFLFPYNVLLSMDSSCQLVFWQLSTIRAFKYLQMSHRIFVQPSESVLMNKMFAL